MTGKTMNINNILKELRPTRRKLLLKRFGIIHPRCEIVTRILGQQNVISVIEGGLKDLSEHRQEHHSY
jgi:hypothetical protein